MSASAQLADEGSFVEYWGHLRTLDPLEFVDLEPYPERVREAQGASRLTEAIVAGTATIAGTPSVLAVIDFGFMGGSMGSVVGEKLWRAAAAAADEGRPLVAVASSGGARMQEGALSLMQMAKTTCAVDVVNDARVPFVAVMADPCTGGVVASFVSLADICVAEPGALLYFSGPRVIAQTTREAAAGRLRHRRAQPAARPPRRRRAPGRAQGQSGQLPPTAEGRWST